MAWLIPRLSAMLLLLALGGAIGGLIGHVLGATTGGVALGMLGAGVVALLLDGLGAAKLVHWLRGTQEGDAPRNPGLWGELAYRIERNLRRQEAATSRQAQRLKHFLSAIEALPNGVVLLDAQRQIEWCNAVAADHLGLDPQRDLGQPVTNLVRAPAFVELMLAGEFDQTITMPGPRGHGALSVLTRAYDQGQVLVITQDVTERQRSDAMRRDFVANVSHEIRTPLTVLAGFVETMSTLPLSETERARVLVLMQQQTDRMQWLVSDLLTLAQIEGGPRPATDRWVSVAGLVQRVHTEAHNLSKGRHTLHLNAPESAQIAGTDAELHSALGNLVSNAVRYTPEGGVIEIGWRARPEGGAELEVRDTGIGIAREHLPRLAERFYRVDSSRARDTGGTGLGLAIVKHVMQRHGGSLEVDSELGRGSRFRLVLPASRVRLEPTPGDVKAVASPASV